MCREYIKGFVFLLIGITQFMQCVMLRKGLHINRLSTDQDGSSIEAVNHLQQEYLKLCCVEFACLFQKGREGLEDAMIKYLKTSMHGLNRLGNRYNADCLIISDGYIKVLDHNFRPLDTLYPRIDVGHMDGKSLKRMRDSLDDPNGFKGKRSLNCVKAVKSYKLNS